MVTVMPCRFSGSSDPSDNPRPLKSMCPRQYRHRVVQSLATGLQKISLLHLCSCQHPVLHEYQEIVYRQHRLTVGYCHQTLPLTCLPGSACCHPETVTM